MYEIVLIEKYLPSSGWWKNLMNRKRIAELSIEEIINKYQGFEGELISLFQITENETKIKEIIDECLELKTLGNCLLLHVLSGESSLPFSLQRQAILVGYDVGVCEEEKTIYSSIYNEILFGNLNELTVYKDFLNKNLLFPDKSLAEKYVNLHDKLSIEGKNVEDYEEMNIYEIWKHKD